MLTGKEIVRKKKGRGEGKGRKKTKKKTAATSSEKKINKKNKEVKVAKRALLIARLGEGSAPRRL